MVCGWANGWDSGERRAEANNRLRSVQEFLRRQLAQSMTVYETNDDRRERFVVFASRSDGIEFVAPMPARLGQSGLYRMWIEMADGQLRLRQRPYLPGDPAAGEERVNVLLEGVGHGWAYFGPERDNDQESPHWHADWTSTERRPLLVRLNPDAAGGESWPDLVVALVEVHADGHRS